MLTAYADAYASADYSDYYSFTLTETDGKLYGPIFLMGFTEAGWFYSQPGFVNLNRDKLVKPFRSRAISGHYIFSHGHFILNAGYDS